MVAPTSVRGKQKTLRLALVARFESSVDMLFAQRGEWFDGLLSNLLLD